MISGQLSASIEKVFQCLDADGNGFLDRDELKAGFAAMVSSRPDIPASQYRVFPDVGFVWLSLQAGQCC